MMNSLLMLSHVFIGEAMSMLFPTLFWTQKLWSHLLDKLGKSQCASLQWSPPGQSYIGTPFIIINIALKTEVETTPIRVVTINRRATSLVAALRVWKMVKYTTIRQSRVIRPFQTLSQYVYSPLYSTGSVAAVLHSVGDLPRPGIKPVSLTLQGRFLPTVPPGKPWSLF